MNRADMARGLAEFIGWVTVAGVGAVMSTQLTGWNGSRLVATLQSLTPYAFPLLVIVAAGAIWMRRAALGAVTALVALSMVILSLPLVFAPDQDSPDPDATPMRVASINLLYSNPRTDEVADLLATLDLDVIVFSEFTAEHEDVLVAHPLSDELPNQVNRDGLAAGGMAVWSRFPITENDRADTVNRTIDASIDGPDGEIRVLAVHPPTPIFNFDGWEREITSLGNQSADIDEPLIVIGDFNASYWHPIFRDLFDRDLVDAHMANGSGWSTSWPTDEFVPPFVRLDHALTGRGLVSTDIENFHVPGSDHTGFAVTVTMSER